MIYYKTLEFPNNLNQQQFETSLRKYALRQNSSLDFTFNAINIGTEKMFHGLENKQSTIFTRINTSFEMFLPKVIINVSTDPNVKFYRLRLGAVPMAILGLLSFSLLISFSSIIQGKTTLSVLAPIIIMMAIYLLLIKFETKLTISIIHKAVNLALEKE